MVDLHCHVLPDVDDGAESIEESLKMLQRAAAGGVEIVVATPHFIRGAYQVDFLERQQMTVDLQRAADEDGIEIQIKSGVEYYLSPQILEDTDKLGEFTINNNGRYILFELPMQTIPPSLEEIFFKLKVMGITPILAHPERNVWICRDPNIIFDFVTKGCITQVNVGSILGYYGGQSRKAAQILLNHGMAHVIASDMHSANSPTLDQALPVVEKLLDKERALRMFMENPRHILEGKALYQQEQPQRFERERRGLRGIFSRHRK